MHAFAPRRTTEPQISAAITLGWRIATLYSLHADELPSSPPDGLLPMRRSLPAADRLALELRAAAGDADRVGIALDLADLEDLLELARRAPRESAAEEQLRERIRTWHIHLQTMLWADHEAHGKAYELGSFLSDTSNRVVLKLRNGDGATQVTQELRRVFARERVERVKRLLDDLQARIDPAAARIVKQHLDAWQQATRDRVPRAATRAGLADLDNQAIIWCQLVTGDKEPEAFIGHEERARVRETMVMRMARSYRRNCKAILALTALVAAGVLVTPSLHLDRVDTTKLLAILGPLVGALGLSVTSIGLTVRKSLDARAELLWNTALVDVIGAKTLRVEDVMAQRAPCRARLAVAPIRGRSASSRRRHGVSAGARRGMQAAVPGGEYEVPAR